MHTFCKPIVVFISSTLFSLAVIAQGNTSSEESHRPSTASPQVSLHDTAFAMPQLGRSRRIWIYLPKGYEISKKEYPVLYMHDAQNLFDDSTFRTKPSRKHTFIAGSSMGGLISFMAILKYPEVFGGAGIFSPSFWVSEQLEKDVEKYSFKVKGKVFFYCGGKESPEMIPNMNRIVEKFEQRSTAKTSTITDPLGRHHELTWRKYFPDFHKWLMK